MSERPDDLVQPKDVESEKLMRNAAPDEFIDAIGGADYPTSKPAILRRAMDKGGLDREVPHVLGQIEDRTYESEADIMAEVERVYAGGGGLPIGKPAAPP
jgi:2-methylaconitate cis-trans-isomerase PrpF